MIAKLSVTGCHRSHGAWMIIKKVIGNVRCFFPSYWKQFVYASMRNPSPSFAIWQILFLCIAALENDLFQKARVKI